MVLKLYHFMMLGCVSEIFFYQTCYLIPEQKNLKKRALSIYKNKNLHLLQNKKNC